MNRMPRIAWIFSLIAASMLMSIHTRADAQFNVKSYGAAGDGVQMETAAINSAIDACAKSGGGVVFVPPGRYLSGTIVLKSHVALEISAGATLLASQSPADYPDVNDVWAEGRKTMAPFIYAEAAQNVTITGRGTIDGQGESWWRPLLEAKARRAKPSSQPATQPVAEDNGPRGRPQLIRLVNCKDVVIEKINVLNSTSWN